MNLSYQELGIHQTSRYILSKRMIPAATPSSLLQPKGSVKQRIERKRPQETTTKRDVSHLLDKELTEAMNDLIVRRL